MTCRDLKKNEYIVTKIVDKSCFHEFGYCCWYTQCFDDFSWNLKSVFNDYLKQLFWFSFCDVDEIKTLPNGGKYTDTKYSHSWGRYDLIVVDVKILHDFILEPILTIQFTNQTVSG